MTGSIRLEQSDKYALLRLARASVQQAAAGQRRATQQRWRDALTPEVLRNETPLSQDSLDDAALRDASLPAALLEPRAVFVSLHTVRGHRLRGCIGCLDANVPLADAVIQNAYAAATRDPRFEPVIEAEVHELDIEISVLGPLEDVRDASEIEVGRHGVGVARDGRRGVLLPQVAVQLGWDRDEFLDNVCRKAELPPDAWRHGAAMQRFEAQVFSEAGLARTAESGSDA